MAAMVAKAQDFTLAVGQKATIYVDKTDAPVSETALEMLSGDFKSVLGTELSRMDKPEKAMIIATLDKTLPREGFRINVKGGKVYIEGADAHGLAYGLLQLSYIMGVSPWEWWADCTPDKANVVMYRDFTMEQSPAVAYRGIFINDEDWGILPWSGGIIGPEINEKIFQLMLRLRANYFWPAMHEAGKAFFAIEGNREMAHKYGIYIGGSHCEPMATSPATEWKISGAGEYDYAANPTMIKKFWRERLQEVKNQEIVYTLGMRGLHDSGMKGAKTIEEKKELLQTIFADQRQLLQSHVNVDVKKIPQVFIPYKEVQEVYDAGLQVPEDVTLMWTDDNFGYIRHFPTEDEMLRDGGNGLYYHVSYWGAPHDYLWLGSASPELMRQQLTEAYMRGVQQIWVLNVGDIKPMEYLVEDFLNMAWFGLRKKTNEHLALKQFVKREFGFDLADTLTSVMTDYYRLAFDRKPEHMGGNRTSDGDQWKEIRPVEGWTAADVKMRVADYQRISDAAQALAKQVAPNKRDAYFQLIQYPVQAAAQMNFKYLCPEKSAEAHDSIAALTRTYNKNTKWAGIMDRAPRKLPVFYKVSTSLTYPAVSATQQILFSAPSWEAVQKDEEKKMQFSTASGSEDTTFEIHLLPNFPINGKTLKFSVSVDGSAPQEIEYQTKDHSEEWKRNVLRNYAQKTVTLPVNGTGTHTLTFKALTEGVNLRSVKIK